MHFSSRFLVRFGVNDHLAKLIANQSHDVKRLKETGDFLRRAFAKNLLDGAELTTVSFMNGYGIENPQLLTKSLK